MDPIGRFEIVRQLGRGRWSAVYEAVDPGPRQPVTLEVLNRPPAVAPALLAGLVSGDELLPVLAELSGRRFESARELREALEAADLVLTETAAALCPIAGPDEAETTGGLGSVLEELARIPGAAPSPLAP